MTLHRLKMGSTVTAGKRSIGSCETTRLKAQESLRRTFPGRRLQRSENLRRCHHKLDPGSKLACRVPIHKEDVFMLRSVSTSVVSSSLRTPGGSTSSAGIHADAQLLAGVPDPHDPDVAMPIDSHSPFSTQYPINSPQAQLIMNRAKVWQKRASTPHVVSAAEPTDRNTQRKDHGKQCRPSCITQPPREDSRRSSYAH